MARRRDYENLFRREPPWSWRREVRAALRRFSVALLSIVLIMLAFWLVLWIGAHV